MKKSKKNTIKNTTKNNHNVGKQSEIGISYYIWQIFYPLLVYYASTVIVMNVGMILLGNNKKYYMLCQILVGIVTLPIMYFNFYRKEIRLWEKKSTAAESFVGKVFVGKASVGKASVGKASMEKSSVKKISFPDGMSDICKDLLIGIFTALLLGTAFNNLISMSPLVSISAGYQEANSSFYGSTLLIELIASGFLTPILEEITYRGVIYSRLRCFGGMRMGMVISALIFGIMHFNLVQFLYAFLMGLAFAVILEKTGKIYGTITAHMAINILAIFRTELGWLDFTMDGSLTAWLLSLLILAAGLLAGYFWLKPSKQEKSPEGAGGN